MELHEKVRWLRENKELYQKDIAQILQTTQSYYAQYESGKRQKWLWFYSALVFLIPALLITFYISFIKA